jgi:hypothetical protein
VVVITEHLVLDRPRTVHHHFERIYTKLGSTAAPPPSLHSSKEITSEDRDLFPARAAGRGRSNRHQWVTVGATPSTGDVGLADR